MRVSVMGRPVLRRAERTVETVAVGAACRMIAHVPATCGAAIDVPLKSAKPPPGTDELIPSPGAKSDRNDATFEKYDTSFDLSVEPTLTALEMQAGDAISLPDASLPDAMTLATLIE